MYEEIKLDNNLVERLRRAEESIPELKKFIDDTIQSMDKILYEDRELYRKLRNTIKNHEYWKRYQENFVKDAERIINSKYVEH